MKLILEVPKNKLSYDGYGIVKLGNMKFCFEHHELLWILNDGDIHMDSGFISIGHMYLDRNLFDVVFVDE